MLTPFATTIGVSLFERWSLTLALATIMVNFIAFVAVVWQLRLLARQSAQSQDATNKDHARRRRQATLEFYSATHEKQMEFRSSLPSPWDSDEIAELAEKAKEDAQLARLIASYLSIYEHLAVGVRADVFDLEVLSLAAGGRVIAMVENYYPWIKDRRIKRNQPQLYSELEWLAGTLKDLRK